MRGRLAGCLPLAGSLAAAWLYVAACPPHDWALAAWAVPGLLLVSTRRLRPLGGALCGVLFGVVFGWGMTSWALHASLEYFAFNRLAATGFVVIVWLVYGGIPFGLLVAAHGMAARRLPAPARPLVGAWLWVAGEVLRATLFTGMPWELLGHTQYRQLQLAQVADLGGVYAISFVMAVASLGAAELFADLRAAVRNPARTLRCLVPAQALLVAALGYGLYSQSAYYSTPAGQPRRIAIVQGNVPNAFRWKRVFFERALGTYAELTSRVQAAQPDLIVWPENAVSFYLDREPLLRAQLGAVASQAREGLLVGGPRLTDDGRAHNSAYLLGPGGDIRGVYDKRRLVPLAEYDPLAWLRSRSDTPDAYAPGATAELLRAGPVTLGTLICYEALFPHLVRDLVRRGADLLVNISNDSWLDSGDGAAPRQHLSMVVFRAIETRRYVVRASASGVSGFITPLGELYSLVPSDRAGAAVASVVPLHGSTAYVRWGDAWILLGGLCTAAVLARRREAIAS